MQPLKLFIWIGFIAMLVVMGYYREAFRKHAPETGDVVALELAGPKKGKAMLGSWQGSEGNLLAVARKSILLDFIFILFYVALVVMLSNHRMYREPSPALNNLLRLNVPLALLAGLLDVIENGLMLYNIRHWPVGEPYISSLWVAWPKFILLGWAVLVWLISVVKGFVQR